MFSKYLAGLAIATQLAQPPASGKFAQVDSLNRLFLSYTTVEKCKGEKAEKIEESGKEYTLHQDVEYEVRNSRNNKTSRILLKRWFGDEKRFGSSFVYFDIGDDGSIEGGRGGSDVITDLEPGAIGKDLDNYVSEIKQIALDQCKK